jgi:hypothetical protein
MSLKKLLMARASNTTMALGCLVQREVMYWFTGRPMGHKHVHERVKHINLDLQRAPEQDESLALAEHVVQASLHGGTTRRPGHGQ